MKGVYYRTGAFKGHPVDRIERIHIDTGLLAITNKNIYFSGEEKGFRIPYVKIVAFHPFDEGVGIIRDTANAKLQNGGALHGVELHLVIFGIFPLSLRGLQRAMRLQSSKSSTCSRSKFMRN